MTDESRKKLVRKALDEELSFLNTTPRRRETIFAYAVGRKKMKRGFQLSFGLIMALVLISLSVTALAVNAAIQQYYGKVAQMDAEGALTRWEWKDKQSFVELMKEFEFDIDEADWAIVNDEKESVQAREAAADRIIYARYGALIQEQMEGWAQHPDDAMGMAPDETVIFKERYLTEHPDGVRNWEDLVKYTDALGYYLRDEYYPAYRAAQGQDENAAPQKPEINEAYAIQMLKSYMTEILSWGDQAVEEMTPDIAWDEKFRMWEVSGEVPESTMDWDWEPVTKGPGIEKTETGYQLTMLVDEKGNWERGNNKTAFRDAHLYDVETEENITADRAVILARSAVQEKYGLSDAEMNALFSSSVYANIGEKNGQLLRFTFHTHYAYDRENMYGAVVNLGTGKVEEAYSYKLGDLPRIWTLLDFAARTEGEEGWYSLWSAESKRRLISELKAADVLPEHAYWQNHQPSEEDMDSFAAEAFGVKGFPSAIHTAVIAHALLGDEDTWSAGEKAVFQDMLNKYRVQAADASEYLKEEAKEITGEEAIAIIRKAVCEAWSQPENALDGWAGEAQLVHDTYLGRALAYWRVFLTQPNGEEGKNTFGNRAAFSYRVQLDGTVIDASAQPEWYSPAQEKAMLEERNLYSPEIYALMNRYAQKHGLMIEYEDFFHWPIEHKKACAEEMKPIIAKSDTKDPRLLALVHQTYLLPEADMLSRDEAQSTARRYLIEQFGFSGPVVSQFQPWIVFLKENEAGRAVWKISFSCEGEASTAKLNGLRPDRYYTVELDAKTGEFIRSYIYGRNDGETGMEAWEKRF